MSREKFENDMRAKFDWLRSPLWFITNKDGEYKDHTIAIMWNGWQARQPEIDAITRMHVGVTAQLADRAARAEAEAEASRLRDLMQKIDRSVDGRFTVVSEAQDAINVARSYVSAALGEG